MLLQFRAIDHQEVHALVAEAVQDRFGVAHLFFQRRNIAPGFAPGRKQHDLAGAMADCAQQQVDADRRDMEGLDRNDARRQAARAESRAPAHQANRVAPRFGVVHQQAGILAACFAVDR